MGGKGDVDVSGSGGADPRDEYAHMADVLPSDFPVFVDGAGEIEEIPNGLTPDAGLYYFQSTYVFNTFPGSDGFFGFSDDTTYNDRKDTKIELVEAGDLWVDFAQNRIYSYTNNSSDSYMHICERQLEYSTSGPISIYEDRVSLLGMMNDDITDETGLKGRTYPDNIVGIKGWFAGGDPDNVLGFFYVSQDFSATEVDHMGFYYSTDGGETWLQGSSTTDSWTNFDAYVFGDLVIHVGVWYRCTNAHTPPPHHEPPNPSYWSVTSPWVPDFWGVNKWFKNAAGVQIGNGIPGIPNVLGERAGTLIFPSNLGQGYAIHLSNKGNWVYTSNASQRGAVWERWSLKDALPPNRSGERFCAARHPRVVHTDPVQAAIASNNFYTFVVGDYHGGLGFGHGIQAPADLVEVIAAPVPSVIRVNDSVGEEAIHKMIATYDQDSNQIIIQGWQIGIAGYEYNYLFSNSGGAGFSRLRWRDRFPSETRGNDWRMEACYSPDCMNCYAVMTDLTTSNPREAWFWRSLDFGWTWQRVGELTPATSITNNFHAHWFIILDEFYQVPAQKILAFGNHSSTVTGGNRVWLLTEDGGATWTEVGRQVTWPYDQNWKYGDDDFPCGLSIPYTPPQVIDPLTYYQFDHGVTTETADGTKSCGDAGPYGRGAYMQWIVAGTTLNLNLICSSEAGFIIRADHINELRRKFLELNSKVQTGGTRHVNFGIDVSDLPTVAAQKTAVRRDHYHICKRETDGVIGQVGTVPGSAYYCDVDLTEFSLLMPDPVVHDSVSIRTLIGMRKTLQALYSDGWFCACYSYCPCQTDIDFNISGGKK